MNEIVTKISSALKKVESQLQGAELTFVHTLAQDYHLTFQQIRQLANHVLSSRDWELSLEKNWYHPQQPFQNRMQLWSSLQKFLKSSKNLGANYENKQLKKIPKENFTIQYAELKDTPFKTCPAASSAWLCCGLKTINLVENCSLGCSYCALKDFYPENIVTIANNIESRLAQIQLNPSRNYRITTGEYSDSLLWGNQNGLLEKLCFFAQQHPNAIIELKTKSVNITWLLQHREQVPKNLMVAWSLNTNTIMQNEEAATPPLEQRLQAARKCADVGIKIGFHFHPLIHYQGFAAEYETLGKTISQNFQPQEILFISFGCLSFTKSQFQTIHHQVRNTQLFRNEFVDIGDGKLGYAEPIRVKLYQAIMKGLETTLTTIPHYLCMEPLSTWEQVLPHNPHKNTADFSRAFTLACFAK